MRASFNYDFLKWCIYLVDKLTDVYVNLYFSAGLQQQDQQQQQQQQQPAEVQQHQDDNQQVTIATFTLPWQPDMDRLAVKSYV